MLSKILAVVLTTVVLTVGGYAYWQYTDSPACCGTQAAVPVSAAETPGCCQETSRSACCAELASACCSDSPTVPAEILSIPPREVK